MHAKTMRKVGPGDEPQPPDENRRQARDAQGETGEWKFGRYYGPSSDIASVR